MNTYSPSVNMADNLMLTAKKEFIDNRKAILLAIGSCLGLCILLGAFLGNFNLGGGPKEVFMFVFMFGIISTIAGSLTFSNMKTKESRIATLMLPAAPFYKFFVRWLAVVPGLFLILILGFYLGDYVRIFVNWIMSDGHMPDSYGKVTDIWGILSIETGSTGYLILTLILSGYFFSQAIYILGSILWPKLSYIKTLFILWALQMIAGTAGMTFNHFVKPPYSLPFSIDVESFLWGVAGLIIILTVCLYALTYIRFKHSQVVYKLF